MPPHTSQNGVIINSTNSEWWRGCGERGTLLHYWWDCKLVQPPSKTVGRFLRKLKIEFPYDPANSLLGIYPDKIIIQKNAGTLIFITALLTAAKTWKQYTCPSTEEQIKKMYIHIYKYIWILLSHKK